MFLRDECGSPDAYSLEDSVREVETLIHDIGLDVPLSSQGLKERDIELAADNVIRYMGGSITNDPAMPTREDLVAIIRSRSERILMHYEVEHCLSVHNEIGEAPLWVPEEERLYWTDLPKQARSGATGRKQGSRKAGREPAGHGDHAARGRF